MPFSASLYFKKNTFLAPPGGLKPGALSSSSSTSPSSHLADVGVQAWHVREAYRRLTQAPRGPLSSGWDGAKIDGRHQHLEARAPLLAI